MSKKILFFSASYPKYLERFYGKDRALAEKSFEEQHRIIADDYFGVKGAYVKYMSRLGNDVFSVIANCKELQQRWAIENGYKFDEERWEYDIPLEQIKRFKPDVVYIGSMFNYFGPYLDEVKKYTRVIVAQMACPLPGDLYLGNIDCLVTSFRDFYDDFTSKGLKTEYIRSGFDPEVLEFLKKRDEPYEITFVGGLNSKIHSRRVALLNSLANSRKIDIWGQKFDQSSEPSLAKHYHGEAFALDMYNILYNSKMTFNSHIDMAGDRAGNQRLYEATGVGTLLVTDMKKNLEEFFEPGKEVVAYEDEQDLLEKVDYYMSHEEERAEIAAAGQKRTLTEHRLDQRMEELSDILGKLLS